MTLVTQRSVIQVVTVYSLLKSQCRAQVVRCLSGETQVALSSEQWPCWSMNNCERYNNAGRKSWGVNPTAERLLNTSLDYPGLDLAAICVYKRFQWFWGRHQILHFIYFEGGCEHIKNIDLLGALLAVSNLQARYFTWFFLGRKRIWSH